MIKFFITFSFIFFICGCSVKGGKVIKHQLTQEEIKICLIGDPGLDTPLQKKIAQMLRQEKCGRIYFLGDLVYPDGINGADDPLIEKNILTYYRPLYEDNPSLQIALMLGNHDYAANPEAWFEVAKNNKNLFFPSYYYLEKFGGLCMLTLDTNLFVYASYMLEAIAQINWLRQISSELNSCEFTVAMSHHPYNGEKYFDGWDGSEGVMKKFLRTSVIGKVDMHIAGHIHVLEDEGVYKGTRMLISGTGGELMGNNSGAPGYVVLEYNNKESKKINYQLRRLGPQVSLE